MVQKLQIALIFIILPLVAVFLYAQEKDVSIREIFLPTAPILIVGEIPIQVEIAETELERTKGLSGREGFEGDTKGLLLVFDESDIHGIWMKEMLFPIDVIWIDENLTVVQITEHLTPQSYPKTFRTQVPIKYAVETQVGFSDTFGIGVGDKVRLPAELKPEN